jgi:putative SOS response-associated peptidase YedK
MCGRYNDHLAWEHDWVSVLGDWPSGVLPSYNKAPTDVAAAFTKAGGQAMRWGLVPAWSKEPKTKYATFNATIEGIEKKPAYRGAWKADRRCLIPVAGYYEWQKIGNRKQPFYIHNPQAQPLFMAGLWEEWQGDGQSLLSCTIITREPVNPIFHIHNRMPVMVPTELLKEWLVGDKASALEIASSDVSTLVAAYPVSTFVNSARNNGRRCIERLG